jgi:hypothetical protein
MEIHDPPDHTRYYPSAAGRIEFLSFSPATSLQRLNFRVADYLGAITSTLLIRVAWTRYLAASESPGWMFEPKASQWC